MDSEIKTIENTFQADAPEQTISSTSVLVAGFAEERMNIPSQIRGETEQTAVIFVDENNILANQIFC